MDTRVADIADWLMKQIDTPLIIRKEERGDVDQVLMKLEKVSFLPGDPDRDDYVEDDRLVLLGDGRIATDDGGGAYELPRHSYEIPLRSDFRSELADGELRLTTDRASYRVSPQRPH